MMIRQQNLARQLQKTAGLPVKKLATLMGVSRQAYYKWLRGGPITPEHLMKLEEMLQVYHKKGWLRKAESLTWGLPHRPYEAMKHDLDRLRTCGIVFI